MTRTRGTLIGFVAVLLWSLLALLTVGSAPVPPFQLNAICFGIGAMVGLVWGAATGTLTHLRNVPARVYALGSVGLFGYHALYFAALRLAPAAEAGLIAYLWPLLIVLFSGLLPGERLRTGHLIGAVLGFAGAGLILADGFVTLDRAAVPGYALALVAAIFWASYSVGARRWSDVPTVSVTVFCALASLASFILHLWIETWTMPAATSGWLAVLGLGLGPVGLAFFVWDIGVKRGDIQLLGVASYAAPVLSTLILVLAGVAAPGWTLLAATLSITAGALIAARASAPAGG